MTPLRDRSTMLRPLALLFVVVGCGAREAPAAGVPEAATDPAAPTARDGTTCEPVNYFCGCVWACALVRETGGVYVRLDSEGEQQFVPDPAFEVCDGARCEPGLVMAGDACAEICAPSRAPMPGCARVEGEPPDATGVPCVARAP